MLGSHGGGFRADWDSARSARGGAFGVRGSDFFLAGAIGNDPKFGSEHFGACFGKDAGGNEWFSLVFFGGSFQFSLPAYPKAPSGVLMPRTPVLVPWLREPTKIQPTGPHENFPTAAGPCWAPRAPRPRAAAPASACSGGSAGRSPSRPGPGEARKA